MGGTFRSSGAARSVGLVLWLAAHHQRHAARAAQWHGSSAPAGTEVVAANHGRVVLVGNFFFAGGSIVLDHGGGLFTMYFHLSEFKVRDGDLVRQR